jgi:hypothetical protein
MLKNILPPFFLPLMIAKSLTATVQSRFCQKAFVSGVNVRLIVLSRRIGGNSAPDFPSAPPSAGLPDRGCPVTLSERSEFM